MSIRDYYGTDPKTIFILHIKFLNPDCTLKQLDKNEYSINWSKPTVILNKIHNMISKTLSLPSPSLFLG